MTKYFKAEHSKSKILVSPRVYTLWFFLFAKAHKKKHSKSKILVSPRVYTLWFFLFAKAHKKKRKGFESNFARRNFTNSQRASSRRVNYFYQLSSELGSRASCKLRKNLVFIRFDEEGTIFEKEKRLKTAVN